MCRVRHGARSRWKSRKSLWSIAPRANGPFSLFPRNYPRTRLQQTRSQTRPWRRDCNRENGILCLRVHTGLSYVSYVATSSLEQDMLHMYLGTIQGNAAFPVRRRGSGPSSRPLRSIAFMGSSSILARRRCGRPVGIPPLGRSELCRSLEKKVFSLSVAVRRRTGQTGLERTRLS